jgi:hypothetical protein
MPINAGEIKKLVLDEDDFGHEMRVGKILADLANVQTSGEAIYIESPSHGGTYTDSIMGKLRQFDYRCRLICANPPFQNKCVILAIECKNLHNTSPLVICGRARTKTESYYALIESSFNDLTGANSTFTRGIQHQQLYEEGKFVGKSLLRVKTKRDGTLETVPSADIYERWSQALSSSVELSESACWFANSGCKRVVSLVLPLVVLPDQSLWAVTYDSAGSIPGDPQPAEECQYFVEKRFTVNNGRHPFVLTHIHFVTLTGLGSFLSRFWKHQDVWDWIFPEGSSQVNLG